MYYTITSIPTPMFILMQYPWVHMNMFNDLMTCEGMFVDLASTYAHSIALGFALVSVIFTPP